MSSLRHKLDVLEICSTRVLKINSTTWGGPTRRVGVGRGNPNFSSIAPYLKDLTSRVGLLTNLLCPEETLDNFSIYSVSFRVIVGDLWRKHWKDKHQAWRSNLGSRNPTSKATSWRYKFITLTSSLLDLISCSFGLVLGLWPSYPRRRGFQGLLG